VDTNEYTTWIDQGRALARSHSGTQWELGDWWNEGSDRQYGTGETEAAKVGVALKTLQNYATIARAFDSSRRREDVSFSLHAELATYDDEYQDELLDKAIANEWSVRELHDTIHPKRRKVTKQATRKVKLITPEFVAYIIEWADESRTQAELDAMTTVLGDQAKALETALEAVTAKLIKAGPVTPTV